MSKKLKRKAILMVVIEIISVILLGFFLTGVQTDLSVKSQARDTKVKLDQVSELIEEGKTAKVQTTETYDEVYQSKAASFAYMAGKQGDFPYTDAKMKEMQELLEVTNIAVTDKAGNIIAKAQDSVTDFTYDRYNQLKTVFDGSNEETAKPMEVTTGEVTYRYYAAKIDDNRMTVIEQEPKELNRLLEDTSTWKGMLGNVSVGLDGYAFVISSQNYTFLYHPDEDLIEQDALTAGIKVDDLENDNYTWMTVNDEKIYCGVRQIDDAYIICAVPESEIAASRAMTVGIVLFVFFAVMTIIILYALLIMREQEQAEAYDPASRKSIGKWKYNKLVARKIGVIAGVGLVCILVISVYMQTLFSLSRQSMSGNQHVKEVQKSIDKNKENIEFITNQYNARYLNKCQTAAYILENYPELMTREELGELGKVLDVESINIFDNSGIQIMTNSIYTNFKLSDTEGDQSYEFRKLLNGADHLIQEAKADEVSGEYLQYIGVVLRDSEGNADGFVQIAVAPDKLETALANTNISTVLDGIKVGTKGFAFAVNKKDKTFAQYPKERMIGKGAEEYGMEVNQFRDEYSGYLTVGTDKYYGSSLETDKYYVYVVVPEAEMTNNRLPVAAMTGIVSLLFLLIAFFILVFGREKEETEVSEKETQKHGPMVDVVMPDGSLKKTEAATSRWANVSIKWDDKTPEQQIFSVLKGIFSILALVICVIVLFEDELLDGNSIILYVLKGNWEKGMNIFALTGSIMIICVVSVVSMLLRKILALLSKTFGARGETVCRLLSSFVKYITVIAMMYYCFALFGVDTATLLASAGILSLVIGLGAKELISDILAGLFIIFEGEFRVGDIVMVGDWRGTVIEIGIRTTKIKDASNNIKIISNSAVSGVINMTRQSSFASCDVGIEYGESLEKVENILEKELPNIKRRVPAIQDGPFYKGVVELADNSVNIRIVAQCQEADRIQVGRDLNREMKILFDKYDINIPFPQVVLNQPTIFEKATAYEKMRADEFNKKQKELSKELTDDDEEH